MDFLRKKFSLAAAVAKNEAFFFCFIEISTVMVKYLGRFKKKEQQWCTNLNLSNTVT